VRTIIDHHNGDCPCLRPCPNSAAPSVRLASRRSPPSSGHRAGPIDSLWCAWCAAGPGITARSVRRRSRKRSWPVPSDSPTSQTRVQTVDWNAEGPDGIGFINDAGANAVLAFARVPDVTSAAPRRRVWTVGRSQRGSTGVGSARDVTRGRGERGLKIRCVVSKQIRGGRGG